MQNIIQPSDLLVLVQSSFKATNARDHHHSPGQGVPQVNFCFACEAFGDGQRLPPPNRLLAFCLPQVSTEETLGRCCIQ